MIIKFWYSFKFIYSTSESIDLFQPLSYIQYGKTGYLHIFGINNNQTFISQILTLLGPLRKKINFFKHLSFEAERNFDHRIPKTKSHSTRTSKRYLNDKRPIHGREIASILRFSTERFKSSPIHGREIASTFRFSTERLETSPIHGRKIASIFRFSTERLETSQIHGRKIASIFRFSTESLNQV